MWLTHCVDVVFPVRPGDSNEELRYSLRSLAKHVPHHRVWIAGYRPSWVSGEVGYIPVHQYAPRTRKWANARANRWAACHHPEVSEQFYLFNDDMFVMQPVSEIPVLHRGRVTDVIRRYKDRGIQPARGAKGSYLRGMIETLAVLRALGIHNPLSYELHIPLPVTKHGLAAAIDIGEQAKIEVPHIRTIFGNLYELGGVETEDVKIKDLDSVPPDDAVFVSTTDASFRHGQVGEWIRARFPDPCRYERR